MLTEVDIREATSPYQAQQPIIPQLLSNQVPHHGTFFFLKIICCLSLHKQCSKSKKMSQGDVRPLMVFWKFSLLRKRERTVIDLYAHFAIVQYGYMVFSGR
jgi:hypothetical protein